METIITALQSLPYWEIISAVVVLASAIAAVTPTPKEGSWLAKGYALLDLLALNVGKAKDKGTAEDTK